MQTYSSTQRFEERRQRHDQMENAVMDIIRPFTTRRHLPDRFISLNDKLCAWDMKTNVFVEKNSHDEYFRLFERDGVPVFIVYQDKGERLANWIQQLRWEGPLRPSAKSTSGDPYYRISNGIPLQDFLEVESGSLREVPAPQAERDLREQKRDSDWLGF